MPAYVIVQGEVDDLDAFDRYRALAPGTVADGGGTYLARGGHVEPLEGEAPPARTTVLEFPTREAALAWYHGEQYTAARALRAGAARFRMYVVDGL